ncbi:hypothetical protein HOE31_00255 [bacterium]|jgi:hypothetical protein|nr:hypothetical protein [bacterium]MBT4121373.1 hypothetical protein [bacterium]MBT4335053.1 hypothetical protein [bacterium]MBT4495254.1 hypothetical protein [bacterium]MBT4763863.1 hypothetical protein [bacterium]
MQVNNFCISETDNIIAVIKNYQNKLLIIRGNLTRKEARKLPEYRKVAKVIKRQNKRLLTIRKNEITEIENSSQSMYA